jgi:hypothetical protein
MSQVGLDIGRPNGKRDRWWLDSLAQSKQGELASKSKKKNNHEWARALEGGGDVSQFESRLD